MFAIAPLLPGFHQLFNVISLTTSPAPVISANPRRAMLYISNATTDDVFIWMTRSGRPPTAPHFLVAPDTVFRFTWSLDGPLSTLGWTLAFRATPGDVAVTEVLWLPDQLAQSLASL